MKRIISVIETQLNSQFVLRSITYSDGTECVTILPITNVVFPPKEL